MRGALMSTGGHQSATNLPAGAERRWLDASGNVCMSVWVYGCTEEGLSVMSPRDHDHPVNPERVGAARTGVLSLDDAGRLAGLLGLLADPVRSRILFALVAAGELCVGDLALALDASEDQVSYALKMLRLAGLV